jgi:starch synthase (maltosyl-transferring)
MARAPANRKIDHPHRDPLPHGRGDKPTLSDPSTEGASLPDPAGARRRVAIEAVTPELDLGRFPAKRSLGEQVVVEADVFADGHDALAAVLRYRHESSSEWTEAPMTPLVNDRWRGRFSVTQLGRYVYTVEGWVDPFKTWNKQLAKRIEANQDVRPDLEIGARLVEAAAKRSQGEDAGKLAALAQALRKRSEIPNLVALARQGSAMPAVQGELLATLMDRHADRTLATTYARELEVVVDPERARFGAWYELFPRSAGKPGSHGTFRDVEQRLPYVSGMGFDILYLPPIHPIGRTHRKGRNNSVRAAAGDPGSPWAIGSEQGGHKSVNPDLGTLEDFRRFVRVAGEHGLAVALDIAFQCSPDHPYVREHPEWFKHRPDGSIQFAENPPKKYEDIVPFDFETETWRELWQELLSVVQFWIDQGVRIFRVDNPHTKPFPFWEWLIGEVKRSQPDVIFLAEAFTRPRVMNRLAKLGFSQSYTYFTWRNTAWEIVQYFTELSRPPVADFLRPNLWPNTPDILNDYLQTGGRPAFAARFLLAATLGASYGIYGPAFELGEARPREPGSEEYLDSEKYQLRSWKLDSPDNLRELITLVNKIRRENPALQTDRTLRFHTTENEWLVAYTKSTEDLNDVVLTVVNVDPRRAQAGMVTLPLDELGLPRDKAYQAHELLTGARYVWNGPRNYVEINPSSAPGQIFRLRRQIRSEHDFEYFL